MHIHRSDFDGTENDTTDDDWFSPQLLEDLSNSSTPLPQDRHHVIWYEHEVNTVQINVGHADFSSLGWHLGLFIGRSPRLSYLLSYQNMKLDEYLLYF